MLKLSMAMLALALLSGCMQTGTEVAARRIPAHASTNAMMIGVGY